MSDRYLFLIWTLLTEEEEKCDRGSNKLPVKGKEAITGVRIGRKREKKKAVSQASSREKRSVSHPHLSTQKRWKKKKRKKENKFPTYSLHQERTNVKRDVLRIPTTTPSCWEKKRVKSGMSYRLWEKKERRPSTLLLSI